MKYMGSKLALLENGLDVALQREVRTADRFVDLFCGTGRVAWYMAETTPIPVFASDLQEYAVVLAGAIIERTHPVVLDEVVDAWLRPAEDSLYAAPNCDIAVMDIARLDADAVGRARELCSQVPGGMVWNSYGGHYFSPLQAATFDHLIEFVPQDDKSLSVFCRAVLVLAASRCVAAPGHTAQPFQPSATSLPFIRQSWQKEPIRLVLSSMADIAPRFARMKGETTVADANMVVTELDEGDVVFVDPPYSNVQYSRFYHVLETIARGRCSPVTGVGRYPPRDERPRSAYSLKSQARIAMRGLLQGLAHSGCRVILTFPYGYASNGLSGRELVGMANDWFEVDMCIVDSRFSTLGGNGYNRRARHRTQELLLTMRPA